MKKINLLAITAISLTLLSSCGGKNITVKGADGTEYESYQAACRNNDFEAAYKFIDALEEYKWKKGDDWEIKKQTREAKIYVQKQEAMFLAAHNTPESTKRILFLLNEDKESAKDIIPEIINFAIIQENNDLLCQIVKQYEIKEKEEQDKAIKRLAEIKEDKFSDLAAEITVPQEELPHPAIGLCDYYEGIDAQKAINKHNDNCRKLLNIAINAGNDYLAQKALQLFTKDIVVHKGGTTEKAPNGKWISSSHSYVHKYTEESKKEAQLTYQEAVKNGAFK